jgi:hypothetical protein
MERIARMEAFLQNSNPPQHPNPTQHTIQQLEPTPPQSIHPVLRRPPLQDPKEDYEIRTDRATVTSAEDAHVIESNRNTEGSEHESVNIAMSPNDQTDFSLLQVPKNTGFTPVVDVHNSMSCGSDCSRPIEAGSNIDQNINSPENVCTPLGSTHLQFADFVLAKSRTSRFVLI